MPASLLGNWQAEAGAIHAGVAADVPALVVRRPRRLDAIGDDPDRRLAGHDLVVTTYGMAMRHAWLAERPWDLW